MILLPSPYSLYTARSLFLYQGILELKKLNNSLPTLIRIDILYFLGKTWNSRKANLLEVCYEKMTEMAGIETNLGWNKQGEYFILILFLGYDYSVTCHK